MSEEDSSRRPPPSARAGPAGGAAWAHPEIELYASEALARFGASGALSIEGSALVWYAPQGVLRVALGHLDAQWSELTDESRRRRCGELVRQLMSRRSLLPTLPPRRRAAGWLWPLVVVLAAALAGWAAYAARPRGAEPRVERRAAAPEPSSPALDAEEARRERSSRVCENARARLLRGATLGASETEGWEVDILLFKVDANEPLDRAPALDEFVGPPGPRGLGPFVWAEQPEMARLSAAGTGVRVTAESIAGASGPRATGVRLTFTGGLIDSYFRPEERVRYFHVATALSERLGASHAGLVARCEDGSTHHAGSWFRGTSPGDAAAALLYVVGIYAEPPHLADPFLAPLGSEGADRGFAFAAIREATGGLDQRALAALLGKSGGMITAPPGGAAVITFPFTDGNRASRASREVARAVHIGRR